MMISSAIFTRIVSSFPISTTLFVRRVPFWKGGTTCSCGYLHQFMITATACRHSPSRASTATSRIDQRHSAMSPFHLYGGRHIDFHLLPIELFRKHNK